MSDKSRCGSEVRYFSAEAAGRIIKFAGGFPPLSQIRREELKKSFGPWLPDVCRAESIDEACLSTLLGDQLEEAARTLATRQYWTDNLLDEEDAARKVKVNSKRETPLKRPPTLDPRIGTFLEHLIGTWELLFGGAFGKVKVKGKPVRFLEACCTELASSLRSGNFWLGDERSAPLLVKDLEKLTREVLKKRWERSPWHFP